MTRVSNKHDSYAKVEVRLLRTSEKAVLVAQVDGDVNEWIPRTLFSLASEAAVDAANLGDVLKIEVRAWKLRELGFD